MGITRTKRGALRVPLITEKAARYVAQRVLTRIRIRTFDRGQGVDGRSLPNYTPAYRRLRARLGLRTSPPDYTRTGRLRRSTRVRSIRRTANGYVIRIGPTGQRIIVGAALDKRGAGWLGETGAEKQKTRADIRKAIERERGGA